MKEASFIFTTPFNVNVVEVKGEERVFMEGFISTTDKDLVNDVVTKNCLSSMQQQILERNIKLDIEHESFRGNSVEEKEINKTRIPAGKITDATVRDFNDGRFGLGVKAELNRNHKEFDKIKGNVLEKYLDAFSIAYIPTKIAHKSINGEEVRLLDDIRLLNVALTGNPVNTVSQVRDVFMKSIDAVEEYKNEKSNNPEIENQLEVKNHNHVSDTKLNYGRKNMVKGKDKTKPEEEKENSDETKDSDEGSEVTEEKSVNSESGDVESKSELKALREEVNALKKDNAEIKALLKRPVHKSMAEPQRKEEPFEQKSIEPLDAIA